MLFAITGWFRPHVEVKRAAIHESYNEHLAQRTPRVRLAGPLRDAKGERVGVFILLEASDLAAAQAFAQASPYTEANLYAKVEVNALDLEVGNLD